MLASNISKPVASSSSNTNYGGKKPLPSSSCWVWEGWWGTLCSLTLNQQDERYWSSHDTALLGQETTSGLFPGFSWVPIPTGTSTSGWSWLSRNVQYSKTNSSWLASCAFHVRFTPCYTTSCSKQMSWCTIVWEEKNYIGGFSNRFVLLFIPPSSLRVWLACA